MYTIKGGNKMREGNGSMGKHGHREHGEHHGRGHSRKHHLREGEGSGHRSAQTFRRGRAVAFLDKLLLNRATLQRQLNEPELEAIKTVISGELKATEAIIEEFIHTFQLQELTSEVESNENSEIGDMPTDEHNK